MTNLETYIDCLVRLGFTGVSADALKEIWFRNNLEPYTFMVEEKGETVSVHITGLPHRGGYFTMEFKGGRLVGYGNQT